MQAPPAPFASGRAVASGRWRFPDSLRAGRRRRGATAFRAYTPAQPPSAIAILRDAGKLIFAPSGALSALAALGAAIFSSWCCVCRPRCDGVPGHATFAEAARRRHAQPWRRFRTPRSPGTASQPCHPLAAGGLARSARTIFAPAPFMIAIAIDSAVFGRLQLTSEPDSPLYLYRSPRGAAVGLSSTATQPCCGGHPRHRSGYGPGIDQRGPRVRLIIAADVGVLPDPGDPGHRLARRHHPARGEYQVGLMGTLCGGFVSRIRGRADRSDFAWGGAARSAYGGARPRGRAQPAGGDRADKSGCVSEHALTPVSRSFFPVGSGFGCSTGVPHRRAGSNPEQLNFNPTP